MIQKCAIIVLTIRERSLHMTQSNVTSLPGSDKKYQVHPEAKRYTMRDNAFTETKNGNFQYERVLSTKLGSKTASRLKITVSKDFTKLTISTVASNGVRKVDLYANDQLAEERELAEFYLKNFVQEGVLQEAE